MIGSDRAVQCSGATPPAALQLDIFEHSCDVMLRNAVAQALEAGDAAAARVACDALAAEFGHDELLPAARRLTDALGSADAGPLERHDALARERRAIEEVLRPAALRVLGESAAQAWLAARWRELARRAGRLTFDPTSADDHAAPLWLRAGDWAAAEAAVAGIVSWRRIPAPLAWMVEARLHTVGLQPAWPLIVELAWIAPRRLDGLLRRAPDPRLERWWRAFVQAFEGEGDANDLAWFPAWMLTQHPEHREALAAAQPGRHDAPEQALRVLVELLGLEKQGRQRDIAQRRRTLRESQASLYAAYMATR